MVSLTPHQKDIYTAIQDHQDAHGWAPTYRELADVIGSDIRSIWESVQAMAKKGYLRVGGSTRQIVLLRSVNNRKIRE